MDEPIKRHGLPILVQVRLLVIPDELEVSGEGDAGPGSLLAECQCRLNERLVWWDIGIAQ